MHTAVGPGLYGNGRSAAVHEFGKLLLIALLFFGHPRDQVFVDLIFWTFADRSETTAGFCIEHIALLAHVDLRLMSADLEMVVSLLEHLPERHVWRIAVPRHVQRCHPER